MDTDTNYLAVGGNGADPIGVLAWSQSGFFFDIGVQGVGGTYGVVGGIDGDPTGTPSSASYGVNSAVFGSAGAVPGVAGVSGTSVGVFGQGGAFANDLNPKLNCGVLGTSASQVGVMGVSDSGEGVRGRSGSGVGVRGTSNSETGVTGESKTSSGVDGKSDLGAGVSGISNNSFGVLGQTGPGVGVFGTSNTWIGVAGFSLNQAGVAGFSGPSGPTMPTMQQEFPSIAGVFGTSGKQAGVVGTSNASAGVYGFSTNDVGVRGEGPVFAGAFKGDVSITGNLTVTGSFPKGCAVPFPDGTQRLLYCMESPEVWFEDFGTAKLDGGRAVVKLDADFVKVIKRGDYRVFLTAEGDCRGLYVRRKITASFEVCELMGGKSSITFSYRIVGRRKDVSSQKRFPKFDVPPPMRPAPRRGRTRSSLGALLAKLRKQAGARPGRARRRKTARAPQPLPTLLAKLRKQAGAKAARRRKRGKKRA